MSAEGRIPWYRSPLSKEEFQKVTGRSDWKGFCQSTGYLAVLCLTGGLSVWSWRQGPWFATVAFVFLHGMVCAFSVNAMHELNHTTVFNNQSLNSFFLYLFSFIGWHNPAAFRASHTKHHLFTLHPPRDREVLPDTQPSLKVFLSTFIDPRVSWGRLVANLRYARRELNSSWEETLLPTAEQRGPLARWARVLLAGHGLIVVGGLVSGWWIVPVVVSLTPSYGSWLQYLCNDTQHTERPGHVPDWRICARSIQLPAVLGFLYWHMQYHVEHHMFAAVPCYQLKGLNRLIRKDLPASHGLIQTWRELIRLKKK